MNRELRIILRTVRHARDDGAGDLASAIAFWAFFSVFPLFVVILSVAGHYLESLDLQARIGQVAGDMLPGSAPLVRNHLESVVRYSGAMTWIGLAGLLWAASRGFGAATRAVNRAIGVKPSDAYLLRGVRSILLAVTVTALMIVSVGVTVAIEVVLEPPVLARLGFGAVRLPRLPVWTLSFALVFLVFTITYKLAPAVPVRWRQTVPGALLAAVLFELGKAMFVFYLDSVAQFEVIYGSLTSIIVMLLWLYVSAFIFLVGAEYNIARARDRAGAGVGGTGPSG